MTIREQFTVRPYQPTDYTAMADLANAARRAVGDQRVVVAEELRRDYEDPDFDATNGTFIFERGDELVGFGEMEFAPENGVIWADGQVHPKYQHQGIGTEIIRRTEARAREWIQRDDLPPDQPIAIHRHTVDLNHVASRLLEAEGYRHIRTFHHMFMELDQPIDVPPLPSGITLRPFDPAQHARAVYETHMESFADHWGFDRQSYDSWTHTTLNRPNNDFSLWLVAYDGDEVAGIGLNRPYGKDKPHMGWVWELGVRRPWRKRGLGSALLARSLVLLREKGYTDAGLGVDSSSLTNAVALYERVGMTVQRRLLVYRKILRGAFEDSTTPAL